MITKAQIHFVKDLHSRKARREQQLFFCEGTKGVKELLGTFDLHSLFAEASWTEQEEEIVATVDEGKVFIATEKELERMSALKTAQEVIAVFYIPPSKRLAKLSESGLVLALDHVSDPGNLGTIIRTADWYGIDHILCSMDTVDVWSPKVVQATMGSLGRVQVEYVDLREILSTAKIPVLATAMEGTHITTFNFPKNSMLLMGNESVGVAKELFDLTEEKIHIPAYGHKNAINGQAESLNVAMATGIVLQEYRRQHTD